MGHKFKIGDIVKYIGPELEYYNVMGEVKSIDTDGFVEVNFSMLGEDIWWSLPSNLIHIESIRKKYPNLF